MEFDGSVLTNSSSDTEPGKVGDLPPMTLHCQHCNAVLGDSVSVCGEVKSLKSIICLKVTSDVLVCDPVKSPHKEGKMARCIYSPLKCRCCCSSVGKVILSSPPCLNTLRSLFLLNKANISCYILKSSAMVKASAFQFNQEAMGEGMKEMKQELEEYLDRLAHIKSLLVGRSRTRKNKK